MLLATGSGLIGPELFQAAADLRADANERTMVVAANRLLVLAVAVVLVGSVLALVGVVDPSELLARTGRP
jgi:hypothetical protein